MPDRFQYFARKRFLWFWEVVNELGKPVKYGDKTSCQIFAAWLNVIWENGYIHGMTREASYFRYDETVFRMNSLSQEQRLQAALEREDYEEAAKIRDMLNRK